MQNRNILQSHFDVKKIQADSHRIKKALPAIRKVLFWDTDFEKIDWIKNRKAVIKRIFERGTQKEINEIIQFYGKNTVREELRTLKSSNLPSFQKNVNKYLPAQ